MRKENKQKLVVVAQQRRLDSSNNGNISSHMIITASYWTLISILLLVTITSFMFGRITSYYFQYHNENNITTMTTQHENENHNNVGLSSSKVSNSTDDNDNNTNDDKKRSINRRNDEICHHFMMDGTFTIIDDIDNNDETICPSSNMNHNTNNDNSNNNDDKYSKYILSRIKQWFDHQYQQQQQQQYESQMNSTSTSNSNTCSNIDDDDDDVFLSYQCQSSLSSYSFHNNNNSNDNSNSNQNQCYIVLNPKYGYSGHIIIYIDQPLNNNNDDTNDEKNDIIKTTMDWFICDISNSNSKSKITSQFFISNLLSFLQNNMMIIINPFIDNDNDNIDHHNSIADIHWNYRRHDHSSIDSSASVTKILSSDLDHMLSRWDISKYHVETFINNENDVIDIYDISSIHNNDFNNSTQRYVYTNGQQITISSKHNKLSSSSITGNNYNMNHNNYYEAYIHPGMYIALAGDGGVHDIEADEQEVKEKEHEEKQLHHITIMTLIDNDSIIMRNTIQHQNHLCSMINEFNKYPNNTIETITIMMMMSSLSSLNSTTTTTSTTTTNHNDSSWFITKYKKNIEDSYNNNNNNTSTSFCWDKSNINMIWYNTIDDNEADDNIISYYSQLSSLQQIIYLDLIQPYCTSPSASLFRSPLWETSNNTSNDPMIISLLSKLLHDDGIVIVPLGQSYYKRLHPPSNYTSLHENEMNMPAIISKALIPHVEGMLQYTESSSFSSSYIQPQYNDNNQKQHMIYDFLVATKSRLYQSNILASEAEIQLSIRNNINKFNQDNVDNDNDILHFFDGSTMQEYKFPSRITENQWLIERYQYQYNSTFLYEHGYDPNVFYAPNHYFEVNESTVAKGGRGVFAKELIPKDSTVGFSDCVNTIYLSPKTYKLLYHFMEYIQENNYHSDFIECLANGYVDGYGWNQNTYGQLIAGIEPGIFTFANHGCSGSNNIGKLTPYNEMNIDLNSPSLLNEIAIDVEGNKLFDVYDQRHFPEFECHKLTANRDIYPGEEIFDNYISYGGEDEFMLNAQELHDVCVGGIGSVSEYEQRK